MDSLDEQHERAMEADDPLSDLLPEGVMTADGFLALPIAERLAWYAERN